MVCIKKILYLGRSKLPVRKRERSLLYLPNTPTQAESTKAAYSLALSGRWSEVDGDVQWVTNSFGFALFCFLSFPKSVATVANESSIVVILFFQL